MNKEDLKNIPFISLNGSYFTYNEIKDILDPFLSSRRKKPEYIAFIKKYDIDNHVALTSLRNARTDLRHKGLDRFLAARITSNKYKSSSIDYGLSDEEIKLIREYSKTGEWNLKESDKSKKSLAQTVASMNWFDNSAIAC